MSSEKNFTSYEYKEVVVPREKASLYLDAYESFGWKQDENFPPQEAGNKANLKLKRDRRRVNRAELTRLQRHFEADMEELDALEKSPRRTALRWALGIALAGTAFMAGSVFAVTAKPPHIPLCIVLAVPAFAGWIAPYFVYQWVRAKKARQTAPFLEEKMEEIYALCEKGQTLL